MNKAVMISIQPKWCDLIARGKKTIEVRKTAPKLRTPFKCYIYCTASDVHNCLMVGGGETQLFHCCNYKTAIVEGGEIGNGKVIGEFVCDEIYEILGGINDKSILDKACLTVEEAGYYLGRIDSPMCYTIYGIKRGYGWHISNLKIYDTPKELGEFNGFKKCIACKVSGYEVSACIHDEKCMIPVPLTRPPMSWQYVEEI